MNLVACYRFIGFVLLLQVLTQCKNTDDLYTSGRLKSVEGYYGVTTETTRLFSKADVTWDGDLITKYGSSTYSYNSRSQIEKEEYRIQGVHPEHVTWGDDIRLVYRYQWDDNRRLRSITFSPDESLNVLPGIVINADLKIFYEGESNRIHRVEGKYPNNDISFVATYYYRSSKIDSVVVDSHYPSINPPLIPLEDYNNWTGSQGQQSTPNTSGTLTMRTSYQFTYGNKSPLDGVFASLGVLPRTIYTLPFYIGLPEYEIQHVKAYVLQNEQSTVGSLSRIFSFGHHIGKGGRLERLDTDIRWVQDRWYPPGIVDSLLPYYEMGNAYAKFIY